MKKFHSIVTMVKTRHMTSIIPLHNFIIELLHHFEIYTFVLEQYCWSCFLWMNEG